MATFTFYPDQRIIEVDYPYAEASCQELINAIAIQMEELLWLEDDIVARWEGKGELQLVG